MNRLYNAFKKFHKWLGVILAIFFILFALSGIVMNHRGFFSRFDVNRNWLPKEYRFSNWNNAAVRGAYSVGHDSLLIYGNIGVWLTNSSFSYFNDFNQGFPKGIDNRKVSDIIKTSKGDLFAATLFGLFHRSANDTQWNSVNLPVDEKRIVALEQRGDSLIVVSRSYVMVGYGSEGFKTFSAVYLGWPEGASKRVNLFKTIWLIHSGEIWGLAGKLIVDISGLAMILLSFTGLFYFFAPKMLKRLKPQSKIKSQVKKANRWSYKWHLKVGIIIALLLFIVTVTGMFLRPPLLIPIAKKTVNPIKGSKLDSPNFWNDKLRDIIYDKELETFLLATSDGIYLVPTDFSYSPIKSPFQPPVSVMGINVFWKEDDGNFAVGSFSGLFRWNPINNHLEDYLTQEKVERFSGLRSPFGLKPIAGGIQLDENDKVFFDYNTGAFSPNAELIFPPMPKEIIVNSGMSLWNLALEVHTWRIIGFVIGDFYILVVPLAGILGTIIVITGSVMWIIRYRNRSSRKEK